MKTNLYIIIILVLVSLSCRKKKYPESTTENSPVFYFKATVNNNPVEFSAGMDGYQMYSGYFLDSNNIYNLHGQLKKYDCETNCPKSLEINVYDFKTSTSNDPVNIDLAVSPKYYAIMVPAENISFQSSFNKTGASYLWDFGDGTQASSASLNHSYKSPGKYNVCLTVMDNNSCTSKICYQVKTGFKDRNCMASITGTNFTDTSITFNSSVTGGVPPYQFFWTFGDGKFSTSKDVQHAYRYPGSYPVSLRVVDAANDTTIAYYNAVTKSDASSCAANFKIAGVITSPQYYLPLSKVVITWTDDAGVVYKSNADLQTTGSYFQVVSVTDYDTNENGQPTKKVLVRFKCNVYNGLNKVTIDNAEAIITVAYK